MFSFSKSSFEISELLLRSLHNQPAVFKGNNIDALKEAPSLMSLNFVGMFSIKIVKLCSNWKILFSQCHDKGIQPNSSFPFILFCIKILVA